LAHNDLNPRNILVNEAGMPVLIDFGSPHEMSKKLTTSRGTKGWDRREYEGQYHVGEAPRHIRSFQDMRVA
jgi:serine/threonine protein kinase